MAGEGPSSSSSSSPAASRISAGRGRRALTATCGLAALVVAALVPQFTNDQYTLQVLCLGGLFVLLGAGLNVVVALAGLLDLGYVAFWAIGAYTVAFLASPKYGIHLPTLLVLPIVVAITSTFAVVIGVPTLRLRGDYLAIVTLGFGEVVRISLLNGGAVTGAAAGIEALDPPKIPGVTFSFQLEPYYYLILTTCVLGLACGYALKNSALGLKWQVLRDDELAAKSLGIRPLKYYLLAFGIGGAYGGVSGALFAYLQTTVSPDSFTVQQSFLVLAIVILGGLSGRFWPVAAAALVVTALPEVLRGFETYRLVLFGPVLIVVMIVRAHSSPLHERLALVTGRWRGRAPSEGRNNAG